MFKITQSLKVFFSETTWSIFTRFHMEFLSKGYWQFVQMVPHHWKRWPPCPYIVKKHLKSSSPEPRNFLDWILVYVALGTQGLPFVQMMILGWPLTFLWQVQICIPIQNVEKSFSENALKANGWNLQCLIKVVKVVKLVSYNQNFIPWGYLLLPQGFVHLWNCINL